MATIAMASDPKLVSRLTDRIGATAYRMWFAKSVLTREDQTLWVRTPYRFNAGWIADHFHEQLAELAEEVFGAGAAVQVEVDGTIGENAASSASVVARPSSPAREIEAAGGKDAAASVARDTSPPARIAAEGNGLVRRAESLRHDLERFVVGPSNELAYLAADRLASDERPRSGVLFIHGGCGLGKTHLLQGLCRRFAALRREARFAYTTAEQFVQLYVDAVRRNRLPEFRRRIRELDLLAVDDVHFLANKSGSQNEFLGLFDAIDLRGSRLALASDAHPKMIRELSDALVSRFLSGMLCRVDVPDATTRVRLLRRLGECHGLRLTDAAEEHFAARCGPSVREIEGAVLKLKAIVELTGDAGAAADGTVGRSALDRLFAPGGIGAAGAIARRRPVRFDQIVATVCERLAVERPKLMGRSRHRRIVLARSAAIYLARELTTLSYPELARAMSRPGHSTIVTACQRVQRQVDAAAPVHAADAHLGETMDRLMSSLRDAVLEAGE